MGIFFLEIVLYFKNNKWLLFKVGIGSKFMSLIFIDKKVINFNKLMKLFCVVLDIKLNILIGFVRFEIFILLEVLNNILIVFIILVIELLNFWNGLYNIYKKLNL